MGQGLESRAERQPFNNFGARNFLRVRLTPRSPAKSRCTSATITCYWTSRRTRSSPTTDPVAERARKLGGTTLRSVGHIARLQRSSDNDAEFVAPHDMLVELRDDNSQLAAHMREVHTLCDEHGDVATASLLEVWIDEAERRVWFLFEATQRA